MLSAFVFQMHFCYQPLVMLTETDGARSVRSYDISPTHCRSAGYTQKRLTQNLKVPYYVGEQFSREFSGLNLKNLERTVEDDYISNLRNNCWKEKQQSMFAKNTFIYLNMNIDCCFCHYQWQMIKDILCFFITTSYIFH